jgi:hypothetical protein
VASWPREQAAQWRMADGVKLRPAGGFVGDRGGAQGQRRPSPQVWALAARSGSAGGGLATCVTGRDGGCMVVVAVPGGTAIPRAHTRHRGVRGRCGDTHSPDGEGSEGKECDGGELSSDVRGGGVLR